MAQFSPEDADLWDGYVSGTSYWGSSVKIYRTGELTGGTQAVVKTKLYFDGHMPENTGLAKTGKRAFMHPPSGHRNRGPALLILHHRPIFRTGKLRLHHGFCGACGGHPRGTPCVWRGAHRFLLCRNRPGHRRRRNPEHARTCPKIRDDCALKI